MIFSEIYAKYYDQIHRGKDYIAESQNLQKVINKNRSSFSRWKVLDFGCGTGIHLDALSSQNLDLYGYDRNSYMLQQAKDKYPNLHLTNNLNSFPNDFDLIYSLFDVLSYQVINQDLELFFRSIYKKLLPGGLMVVDGWNLNGVRRDPPSRQERSFKYQDQKISRIVNPSTLDNFRITNLNISLCEYPAGRLLAAETHVIRAFEPTELLFAVKSCGFSDAVINDGRDWNSPLEDSSWKFVMMARKEVENEEDSGH